MSDFNKQVIEEFRANEGKVGGFFANAKLVLLHNVGAKSGQERINPLVSLEDGNRLAVFASAGGAPKNPAWYYNVVANPDVTVEYGTEKFNARASVAQEPERTQLYSKMAAKYDNFREYQEQTERVIPVVILSRAI